MKENGRQIETSNKILSSEYTDVLKQGFENLFSPV